MTLPVMVPVIAAAGAAGTAKARSRVRAASVVLTARRSRVELIWIPSSGIAAARRCTQRIERGYVSEYMGRKVSEPSTTVPETHLGSGRSLRRIRVPTLRSAAAAEQARRGGLPRSLALIRDRDHAHRRATVFAY